MNVSHVAYKILKLRSLRLSLQLYFTGLQWQAPKLYLLEGEVEESAKGLNVKRSCKAYLSILIYLLWKGCYLLHRMSRKSSLIFIFLRNHKSVRFSLVPYLSIIKFWLCLEQSAQLISGIHCRCTEWETSQDASENTQKELIPRVLMGNWISQILLMCVRVEQQVPWQFGFCIASF